MEENKALPDKVKKSDLEGREDLRELSLVTIDGETARDFDDAVYCEKKGRNWRLVVAIADVSHYVRPGMAGAPSVAQAGELIRFLAVEAVANHILHQDRTYHPVFALD